MTAIAEGLPEVCWVVHDTTQRPVLIRRGVKGYFPTDYDFEGVVADDFVKTQNARLGITAAQEKAMKGGSLFGFDKPIADPATYANEVD